MSKKDRQGKCIHCLKWSVALTADHVLPWSWYVQNITSNEEKWTAPSCQICNEKLGKMEKDLFIRLALCMNLTNDFAKSIRSKVLDMLNPQLTKNFVEARARKKKIQELFDETVPADGFKQGFIPNFDYHPGFDPKEQKMLRVPEASLIEFGKKLIKGIEYNKSGRFLDDTYDLEVIYAHPETIQYAINLIRSEVWGEHYYHKQGFEFHRALPPEGFPILYQVKIWGRFEFYGIIGLKSKTYSV